MSLKTVLDLIESVSKDVNAVKTQLDAVPVDKLSEVESCFTTIREQLAKAIACAGIDGCDIKQMPVSVLNEEERTKIEEVREEIRKYSDGSESLNRIKFNKLSVKVKTLYYNMGKDCYEAKMMLEELENLELKMYGKKHEVSRYETEVKSPRKLSVENLGAVNISELKSNFEKRSNSAGKGGDDSSMPKVNGIVNNEIVTEPDAKKAGLSELKSNFEKRSNSAGKGGDDNNTPQVNGIVNAEIVAEPDAIVPKKAGLTANIITALKTNIESAKSKFKKLDGKNNEKEGGEDNKLDKISDSGQIEDKISDKDISTASLNSINNSDKEQLENIPNHTQDTNDKHSKEQREDIPHFPGVHINELRDHFEPKPYYSPVVDDGTMVSIDLSEPTPSQSTINAQIIEIVDLQNELQDLREDIEDFSNYQGSFQTLEDKVNELFVRVSKVNTYNMDNIAEEKRTAFDAVAILMHLLYEHRQ